MADRLIPRGHPSRAFATASPEDQAAIQDGASKLTLSHLKDMTMQKVQEVKERKRVLKPRGPKPEVQPTPTRRQERNRLAQQALRDRRAQYLLFLEQSFTNLQEEHAKLAKSHEELQRQLRNSRPLSKSPSVSQTTSPTGRRKASSISVNPALLSRSHSPGQIDMTLAQSFIASPPASVFDDATIPSYTNPASLQPGVTAQSISNAYVQNPQSLLPLDYPSIAASLILALEHLCIDHVQPQAIRKFHDNGSAHGHALMLITPSASQIESFPENEYYTPDGTDIRGTLDRLLNLSGKLDLSSEKITPVMAWKKLEQHPKFNELRETDFVTLRDALEKDVRCHGFGAVFESHQFDAALNSVLVKKLS